MLTLLGYFQSLGVALVVAGLVRLACYPLALLASLRRRPAPVFREELPAVSVIVPACNEEKVIESCAASILASGYPRLEVILVDDGSRDATLELMRKYEHHRNVRVLSQPNGGKASALNNGARNASGEILFFVDADGIFTQGTIPEMLRFFTDLDVGGVCGNDAPVNLDRLQTKLLCLMTYAGTSFVRRALAEVDCLPIVSGNIGAFRRVALEDSARLIEEIRPGSPGETGPMLDGFIGEDLELTWRVHRAGYKIKFAPRAIVLAEVPSTVRGLWRQRVRWARGFLQTARLHKSMFFDPRYGWIGMYLPVNFFCQVCIPIIHLLLIALVGSLAIAGEGAIAFRIADIVLWLGLGSTTLTTLFAIVLDRAYRDLRYLYVLPLWVPYSIFMDLVMVRAIYLELRGGTARWNKLDRTGVVSRTAM